MYDYLHYVISIVTVASAANDEMCHMQMSFEAEEVDALTLLRSQALQREDLGLMVSNAHLLGSTLNESAFSNCHPKVQDASIQAAEAEPINKVYIPQPDFSSKVEMPREFVESYPQEYIGSMPVEKNGITFETLPVEGVFTDVSGGCSACGGGSPTCACVEFAVLPMDHHFRNIVASRSTLHPKTHEHGELKWIATIEADPITAMIPGAAVMFAEKFMVYDHEGEWQETEELKSADVIDTEPSEVSGDPAVLDRASKVYEFYAGTRLGSLQNAAGYDPAALSALAEYLRAFPLATTSEMQQASAMEAHFQAARARVAKLPEGTAPSSVVTSCHHLMENPLVIRDTEQKKVRIPLNMQIPWARAQTVVFPRYEFSQSLGKGVFRRDPASKRLVFHFGAMTYGSWAPQRTNHGTPAASSIYRTTPKLYVTAPGGVGKPSDQVQQHDLRAIPGIGLEPLSAFQIASDDEMRFYHGLFLRYASLPMSYVWLYRNQKSACNSTVLTALKSQVWDSDWNALKSDGRTREDFEVFARGLVPAFACGLSFLRGNAPYSNGVDALEVMSFAHWMMEWPAGTRYHALRGTENVDEEDAWDWKEDQADILLATR